MIKETSKVAPKRFTYDMQAYFEVNNAKQPIQIKNISKTGIQFYSNVPISKNVQIRLLWQDPKYGAMESNLLIVRDIHTAIDPKYPYCYGSKFVNLKDEVRRNVNRVVETTQEEVRKTTEKMLDKITFKTISDVITHGRAYLRDIIRGTRSFGQVELFVRELKDYEKDAFEKTDEASQWLQKLVTQHFHCRMLLTVSGMSGQRLSDYVKLINDKLQSIECLIAECKKFMDSEAGRRLNMPRGTHETINRLVYSRLELLDVLTKRLDPRSGSRFGM